MVIINYIMICCCLWIKNMFNYFFVAFMLKFSAVASFGKNVLSQELKTENNTK